MSKVQRIKWYFVILTISLIFLSCTINDLLRPLGQYSRAMQTVESKNATRTSYQETLTARETESVQENQPTSLTQEPENNTTPPELQDITPLDESTSTTEPIPGLAGTWAYHWVLEQKNMHMYNLTIDWDGITYSLTKCEYFFEDGSCQIESDSWDGINFSFILYFPHTGTLTHHNVTSVSGDTLTGTRYNEEHGSGTIEWSRVN